MDRQRKLMTVLGGSILNNYYLYDTFTTDRAAGAVNGTSAEPVGGARTVTDTNGKISVAGGRLDIAAGAAVGNGVWYANPMRASGLTMLANVTHANTSGLLTIGWDADTSSVLQDALVFTSTVIYLRINSGLLQVGTYTATSYDIAVSQRANGVFWFIKGGAYTNWTKLYGSLLNNNAMRAAVDTRSASTVATIDNIRIPKQTYIPVPLQSDGMSNSLTDGLGNPETNSVIGTAYEDFGTWGVSGGVRSCSVLGGATGSSVLATSSKNVHIEVNVVRSAGFAGISARRADSSNYIRCTHDGTNVIVTQVIAGTPTVLSTTAVAYSAGATLKFDLLGTAYRAIYNNTAGGSGVVTDTESTNHGLITSGTANTFDNLVIWAKEGYTGLNAL